MLSPSVLSPTQIEQFVSQGFVVLCDAFLPDSAQKVRGEIWKQIGLSPDEPENWKHPVAYLNRSIEGPLADEVYTPRLTGAFDDLMGAERWVPFFALGWWPVSFPGFDAPPWRPPGGGWHVDGSHFHHHINSKEQGLLPLFLFSDIAPGGGGTTIAPTSHRFVAQILANAEPDGLDARELCRQALSFEREEIVEISGKAGDVALLHPFMMHARSANTGDQVRFICNPCFALHEPMNLRRDDPADYSPVERAIVESLA